MPTQGQSDAALGLHPRRLPWWPRRPPPCSDLEVGGLQLLGGSRGALVDRLPPRRGPPWRGVGVPTWGDGAGLLGEDACGGAPHLLERHPATCAGGDDDQPRRHRGWRRGHRGGPRGHGGPAQPQIGPAWVCSRVALEVRAETLDAACKWRKRYDEGRLDRGWN
ncbi:hypothetical protein PVAP13_1KG522604 [Panicum virgatum]|uniref:Uncharacterized protein n=1 Tax=Panicum virgatum TaxID=38727 RepID=A0A8T0XYW2_PANVG|nr:hypothetical protein PVAP13_1KG522604 [Panicum virgatum]